MRKKVIKTIGIALFVVSLIAFIVLVILKKCGSESETSSFLQEMSLAISLACSLTFNLSVNYSKTENNYIISYNNAMNDKKVLDLVDMDRKCITAFENLRFVFDGVVNNNSYGVKSIFDKLSETLELYKQINVVTVSNHELYKKFDNLQSTFKTICDFKYEMEKHLALLQTNEETFCAKLSFKKKEICDAVSAFYSDIEKAYYNIKHLKETN